VAPPQGGNNTVPYQGFKIYEQPAPPDDSAEAPQAAAAPKPAPAPAVAPPAPVAVAPKVVAPPVVAKPAPVKPAPAAAPPKTVAALIQQANSAPPPVAAKPAAAAKSVAPPAATGAPRSLATQAPAVPAAGGLVLQIGSYKSQAEAESAWRIYKAKHAALLSGYSDNIQQADLGEKGTWYRLRIGGFSDKEVATALCDRLKADGGVCIPGR
jgi:cell division protein FtsN